MATVAAAQDASAFKFSGFGSLAATKSSEDKADFITNFAMSNGPGYTRSTDFKGDSRVGLQGDLRMGDYFSAVVQVISEHRYDDTFKPYLNIASLKLQALPGLAFRVGRIPYSAYLISDFQKVGYAQPWVRPPVEVYQFNPLTAVDGADITWQANIGEVAFSGQFLGGTSKAKISPSMIALAQYKMLGQAVPDAEWESKSLGAVSIAANFGSSTLRAFYTTMKGTYDDAGYDQPYNPAFGAYNSPFSLLRVLPPALGGNAAWADQLQIKDKKVTYLSAAYNYDPGRWFLMIEQSWKGGDDTMLAAFQAGYATLGVRLGDWTPYVTSAWKRTTGPTTDPNPIVQAVLHATDHGQSTISGGLRWDFIKNMALKIQYDSVKNDTYSSGALTNTQPGFAPGERYSLSTVALDFVF
jgi:hypothetical protein